MDQSTILTLLQSHHPVWSEILQRIQNDEANLDVVGKGTQSTHHQTSWVDPLSGVTALHLAVDMSSSGDVDKDATDNPAERSSSNNDERLLVIQALLSRHPEATMMQCQSRRWTPLASALAGIVTRMTTARIYVKTSNNIKSKRSATQDVEIIQALLETNPAATLLTDKLGRSPLCLYIQAVSTYYRKCDEHEASPPRPRLPRFARASADDSHSTVDGLLEIVKALVAACSKNRDNGGTLLSNAIETLYRCNTTTIMNMTTKLLELNRQTDEIATTRKSDKSNPQAAKLLDQCWIWHWLKCLLSGLLHCERLHNQKQPPKGSRASSSSATPIPSHTSASNTMAMPKDLDPPLLLHVAARLVDCPTPFVLWTLVRDPSQVSTTTVRSNHRELGHAYTYADGNLPLHSVASWRYDTATTSTTFSTGASAAAAAASSTGRSPAPNTKTHLPPNQAAPAPTISPEPELVPAPAPVPVLVRNKCRKSMILTSLVAAYPPAVKIKNRSGYNPIELEAASGAVIT